MSCYERVAPADYPPHLPEILPCLTSSLLGHVIVKACTDVNSYESER